MYLMKIEIKNYGCIDNLAIEAKFAENGNPYPIVLIGENGTGKTLTIANLVDGLIEIKRETFGESIQEVSKNKYFKIGNLRYIKNGTTYSAINVTFQFAGKELMYSDVMSNKPTEDVKLDDVKKHIRDYQKFQEIGFSRVKQGH